MGGPGDVVMIPPLTAHVARGEFREWLGVADHRRGVSPAEVIPDQPRDAAQDSERQHADGRE